MHPRIKDGYTYKCTNPHTYAHKAHIHVHTTRHTLLYICIHMHIRNVGSYVYCAKITMCHIHEALLLLLYDITNYDTYKAA